MVVYPFEVKKIKAAQEIKGRFLNRVGFTGYLRAGVIYAVYVKTEGNW